jgi:hypothetical protein
MPFSTSPSEKAFRAALGLENHFKKAWFFLAQDLRKKSSDLMEVIG